MKYIKRPVVIEAIQLQEDTLDICLEFMCVLNKGDFEKTGYGFDPEDGKFKITTLEGPMNVDIGDWIIKGVKGEFYPCKPDIFEMTYRPFERYINRQICSLNEKERD